MDDSSRPVTHIIEVAAGLVFRDGKLLIAQRHKNSHLGGLWEFPGGKKHTDESLEECLVRELREELGIEIEVGKIIETITHDYPEKSVRLNFFKSRWLKNEPRALDCADFRWITRNELVDYEFPPADARLLNRLITEEGLWE